MSISCILGIDLKQKLMDNRIGMVFKKLQLYSLLNKKLNIFLLQTSSLIYFKDFHHFRNI